MEGFRKDVCTAVIFYLVCHLPTQASVIWKIQTVPIVLGEDVNIKCFVSTGACHINQTRQWTGGKGYKLIGLNGITTNVSKYDMKVYKSDLSFDLTVKTFSEDDANSEYTCLCGKEQFTDMLMLNKTKYISMPLEDNIIDKSYVKDYRIYLNVTIKNVHPLPICALQYNNNTKILKTSDYKKENNTVYTISYEIVMSVNKSCRITWLVNCTVGQKSFNTDNRTSNECETYYVSDMKLTYVAIGISATVACLFFVVFYVLNHRKTSWFRGMDNGEGEDHIRLQNTTASVKQPMLQVPQLVDSEN